MASVRRKGLCGTVQTYSRQGKLACGHLRNVRSQVPRYRETFIDDGDIDVPRVLRIFQ
jgi:mannonate dehydratase